MATTEPTGVLEFIRVVIPDMPVTKKDLDKPTPKFMVLFFKKYLYNIFENYEEILGKENVVPLTLSDGVEDEVEDVDYLLLLYAHVQYILKSYFEKCISFFDLFSPSKARSIAAIKIALSFATFMDQIKDQIKAVVDNIQEKERSLKQLNLENEELIAKYDDMLQNLGSLDCAIEFQETKLRELLCPNKSEIVEEQHNFDILNIADQEINKLENDLQVLNYELELDEQRLNALEIEEAALRKELVSNIDYEHLKKGVAISKANLEKYDEANSNYNSVFQTKQSNIQHFEELCNLIEYKIDFDKLEILESIHKQSQERTAVKSSNNSTQNEVAKLHELVTSKESNNVTLDDRLKQRESELKCLNDKLNSVSKQTQEEEDELNVEIGRKQLLQQSYTVDLEKFEQTSKKIKNDIEEHKKINNNKYIEILNDLDEYFISIYALSDVLPRI